jgi:hypothetical protein
MRFCIFLLFSTAFLFSCKKESETNKELVGSWNWVRQTNDSWPPVEKTPQTTGINETVTFSAGQTYSIVRNTIVAETGRYSTSAFISSGGETLNKIIFRRSSGFDSVHYFRISGNSLTFSFDYSGGSGGGIRFYDKQ